MSHKVAIAVTTRNRPEIFDVCMAHFKEYLPEGSTFLVLDDNSDHAFANRNEQIARSYGFNRNYQYSTQRLGIAKAKNECFRRTADHDYWFLFDDDCFPVKEGWADLYIDKSIENKCHHMLWNAHAGPYVPIGETNGIREFNAPLGVMLFVTGKALATVGGMNEDFGIYGNEHIKYTHRMHSAGMTNGFGCICSPAKCDEYIYAYDISLRLLGKHPELKTITGPFKCSLINEPLEVYRHEADLAWNALENSPLYIPL